MKPLDDAINAAALKLSQTRKALLMLAGDPYGQNGDFIDRDLYDTLTLEAGSINLRFFALGESPNKNRGFTNLEQNGHLPEGQAFSATHIGLRILPISTGMLADGQTNAVMAELMENLKTCYVEPVLAGKENMGSFSYLSFMSLWNVLPAAGAVGVPQGNNFQEAWRRFQVPFKIPQNTTFGVRFIQGTGADWSSNVADVFAVQCILRGVFARRT
jgi:hypothetical protein